MLTCNVQRPSDQVGYFSITASASSVYISAGQHRTLGVATPNPEDRQRTTCKYSSSRVRKRNLPIYLLLILCMAKLPPNFPLHYNFCQVVINFNVARFVLRCLPAVLIRTAMLTGCKIIAMLTGCKVIACVANLLEYVYMYVRAPQAVKIILGPGPLWSPQGSVLASLIYLLLILWPNCPRIFQPFISTTMTRYLANFINLSPNIVDLWPSEDGDGCDAVPLKYRRATPVLIHERWLSYWSIVAKLPLRSSVCFNFCSVVISCGLICIALPTCCIV